MTAKQHLRALDDAYLQHILELHLNKQTGAPYWLGRAASLGIQGALDIESFAEFKKGFAFVDRNQQRGYERDLRELPIEQFIPLSTRRNAEWIWASETGGTTGIAKRGTWGDVYWRHILEFSDELLDLHEVPHDENWLFIGPTGPHTTGRLLISIAENRGGKIFCIDMDPRIVRAYISEGNRTATEHYIEHIWQQVKPIIRYQDIGVMFCTASLLEMLPQYLDIAYFKKLKAVIHAGLAMSRDTHRYLRDELFPHRPVIGIYGTSVSGISYQKPYESEDDYRIVYIPSQPSIVLEVIDANGRLVDEGKTGDVRCFRFTEDQLIPGFIERDQATRITPCGYYQHSYPWDWIADPHSPASISGQSIDGVY